MFGGHGMIALVRMCICTLVLLCLADLNGTQQAAQHVRGIFDRYDDDNSGSINADEFVEYMAVVYGDTEEAVRARHLVHRCCCCGSLLALGLVYLSLLLPPQDPTKPPKGSS